MQQYYYTKNDTFIRNPDTYAKTKAPMYHSKYDNSYNINKLNDIYKLSLENNKTYAGKTTNIHRIMEQHLSGNGSKVTKKSAPIKVGDQCPGYFADKVEQMHTENYIDKHDNVKGESYTNSKTTYLKCGEEEYYTRQTNSNYVNINDLSRNDLCDSEYEFDDYYKYIYNCNTFIIVRHL